MASGLIDGALHGNLDAAAERFKETMEEDLKKYAGFDYSALFQEKMDQINEFAMRNPELSKRLEGLMKDSEKYQEKLDEFLEEHPELKEQIGGNFADLKDQVADQITVMKDKMEGEVTHL